jgi:hypothetical protein
LQDMPADRYGKAVRIFSSEMKSADPAIQVGAVDPLWDWPPEKIRNWLQEIGEGGGNGFDFWIHHSYSPGTSGKIRGFLLSGPGASVTAPFRLSEPGTCTVRVRAMTNKGAAVVRAAVTPQAPPRSDADDLRNPDHSFPQTAAEAVWNVGSTEASFTLQARSVGEPQSLKIEVLEGGPVLFYHMAEWSGERNMRGTIDLKDSPELYRLIVSGALTAAGRWWSAEERRGKPLFVTEYNSLCESFHGAPHVGFAVSLRDALNLGMYLQSFLRTGVPVAAQWLLYGDLQGFGLIEGVAVDPTHGRELGRPDPHPRPGFYVLKLYRDHLAGELVPVRIESPGFHIGPPGPYAAMGYVNHVSLDVPYLQAVASWSTDGKRISLLVQNLHPTDALAATIRLEGFAPATWGEEYLVSGEHPWTNNEPETCPPGDCVRIHKSEINIAGPEFTHSFPPFSATALVFFAAGGNAAAGAQPQGADLRRTLSLSGHEPVDPPLSLATREGPQGIELRWAAPGAGVPAGYHLYRSRFSFGPFRNLVQALPANTTHALDSPADPCISYTYAVRSVNDLGEESEFSNKATVRWTRGDRACPP